MESLRQILNLVIADDDPDDQYLMQKAIWEMPPVNGISFKVRDVQKLQRRPAGLYLPGS
jgi:hypothetical protein